MRSEPLAAGRTGRPDNQQRAVLWDLDGTLVDSGDYHYRAWRETLGPLGIHISFPQFLEGFGQRNDRILSRWLGPGASAAEIQSVAAAKEVVYRRLAREEGLTPLPGAADWVAFLHHAGWRQAIASSAPAENVRLMVAALSIDGMLDAVVSADDVTAGKPDPQVFLVAAARLGVPPHSCIVVEDAAAGIEAARRAGMKCIGVNRDAALPADLVARSLAELPPDAFEKLLR